MLLVAMFTSREDFMKLCRAAALCAFADEAPHGAGTGMIVGIGRRVA
ncbi:hypothetical protein [Gordonibacter sp. An230]|nr:hypothetical protein [Gordonibacter sp. An230]